MKNRTRRMCWILLLLAVVVASVYFVVSPMRLRGATARSSAGLVHRDAGEVQLGSIRKQYAALSNDYRVLLQALHDATNSMDRAGVDYAAATGLVASLTAELAETTERLEYELGKNVADEQEVSALTEETADALAALELQKANTDKWQREAEQVKTDRVPRAEYKKIEQENARLLQVLKEQKTQQTKIADENGNLQQALRDRDQELAQIRVALDKREMTRELMSSVVAAQLRLVQYDVGRSIHTLTMLRDALLEADVRAGTLKKEDLERYNALVTECLLRLMESQQASDGD